jgi:hypothetical protein
VPGAHPQQAARAGAVLGLPAASPLTLESLLQEPKGGVGLGIEDRVHVFDAADQRQHGTVLCAATTGSTPPPCRGDQPRSQMRVTGTARTEDRLVSGVVDGTGKPQPVRQAANGVSPRQP